MYARLREAYPAVGNDLLELVGTTATWESLQSPVAMP